MSGSHIGDQFARVCRNRASVVAVQDLSTGTRTTFADLANESASIERALRDVGVDRGAAVLSLVGNHPIFFSLLVASMNAGAALVPLGEATDAEIRALVEEAGAIAVITDRDLPFQTTDVRSIGSGMRLFRLADRVSPPQYGASVVLKLTSGSTQLPKAAVAAEAHLVNDGRHVIEAMNIKPTDINFTCIPLSHSYAIGNVVMPLLSQGTGVALRQFFNPAQIVRDVTDTGATIFPGVPFMFERIKSRETIDRLPASLRLLITAGAHINPEIVLWFRRHLDRKLHSFYGSSETGGISYDDSETVDAPLHVGRAMPDTTIVIRQSGDGSSAGRIFVEGNAVASRYAHEADDAVSTFSDGGFLTGDVGCRDGSGRLILTGRVSPLINVAGRKVDPVEVERRLLEIPGVNEARVIGMACQARGQQIVAFLVAVDAALTPLAIRQRCAETLSTHKIPRRFVFVDRLPVDVRGKIDRRALELLASDVEHQ